MKSFISLCHEQALQARLICPPNPAVGAVLVAPDGSILGRGYTQEVGGAHAEVMALQDAKAQDHNVAGGTMYVTLEPCSHHGRTPPCCDALIASGVSKVVMSVLDPNPLVAGQGAARLRAAGIDVQIGPGAAQTKELNLGFFSRMIRKTPWVRLKVAASLDGTTALPNGASQWITSPEARSDGHSWRARACAVLTGVGTVLRDHPRLDARGAAGARAPHRIVLDSQLQTPLDAPLFAAPGQVWIYTASTDPLKTQALSARGATVVHLPNAQGQVDLPALLQDLARREVNEVHVEAGQRLNGALIAAGLVDEFLVYLAPKLLGPGLGLAQLSELHSLEDATQLEFVSLEKIGPDVRVLARAVGREMFKV